MNHGIPCGYPATVLGSISIVNHNIAKINLDNIHSLGIIIMHISIYLWFPISTLQNKISFDSESNEDDLNDV